MHYCEFYTSVVLLISMFRGHVVRSGLRIIGGRDVSPDEFPYVVRLEVAPVNMSENRRNRGNTMFCSASVLTATWTLTAAHCIQFLEKFAMNHPEVVHKNMIRLRHSDLSSNGSGRSHYIDPFPNKALFEILSHYKHPAFKGILINDIIFIENDVGLLNTESISLQQYAKVSAVDFSTVTGQQAVAVGYGISTLFMKKAKNGPALLGPLKVLDLVVVECSKLWHLYPAMCVAQQCGRSPTMCAGDSGGPLIHPSGIIAITSVNKRRDCMVEGKERSNTVGVLTAISPYISWITSHIIRGH